MGKGMTRKDTWWLRDSDTSDPTEWIPVVQVVPEELKFTLGVGIRVQFDCPGKYGGEFHVRAGLLYCYPGEALLRELFQEVT